MSDSPVKNALLARLFGPVADEIGEDIAQWYKNRRQRNLENVLEKAAEKLSSENSETAQPKLNLIYPIINKSSLVEDSFLQEKWANLLASAISKDTSARVHTAFPHILEQLSPLEAKILDKVCEFAQKIPKNELSSQGLTKDSLISVFGISETEFPIAFRNLIRLNLCQFPAVGLEFFENKDARFVRNQDTVVCATEFGMIFVESCKADSMEK